MPRWGAVEVSDRMHELIVSLASARNEVTAHALYLQLDTIDAVRVFMNHHVFAVWDFMSLLTGIRAEACAVVPPWYPKYDGATRRFVNELMLAEESDDDPLDAGFISHFELYQAAMIEAGADTGPIRLFNRGVSGGQDVLESLLDCDAPGAARAFVECTWRMIGSKSFPQMLGAFTFGRESLIPDMFTEVRKLSADDERLNLFTTYLDRHIELDGDEHTPLAYKLVERACGDDEARWNEVELGARTALGARRVLWSGIADALRTLDRAPSAP